MKTSDSSASSTAASTEAVQLELPFPVMDQGALPISVGCAAAAALEAERGCSCPSRQFVYWRARTLVKPYGS